MRPLGSSPTVQQLRSTTSTHTIVTLALFGKLPHRFSVVVRPLFNSFLASTSLLHSATVPVPRHYIISERIGKHHIQYFPGDSIAESVSTCMLAVRVNNLLPPSCFGFDSYSTILANPCRIHTCWHDLVRSQPSDRSEGTRRVGSRVRGQGHGSRKMSFSAVI